MGKYTAINDPSAHFQIAIYTGNGSTQSITNDGNSDLQPDFVWVKNRGATNGLGYHHQAYDSNRGTTKKLLPSSTNAESTDTNSLTAFNSDGFSAGSNVGINENAISHVAWQWKANGGTTVSNTDGTITSTVQANQDAGFSIITYTGTGGGETFGHGLGVAPDMWIVKRRSGTGSWAVGFNDANILGGTSKYLILQSDGATSTYSNFWGSSPASSTVMRIAGDATIGGSGSTYVAYAFAEKQGYSKFGSYIGNGNADGTFVYTGFKPAWVMTKEVNAAGAWVMYDNKRSTTSNPQDKYFSANTVDGENTFTQYDFVSNGFKFRTSGSENSSGNKHIYIAFAESPFVTSTGIMGTAR